MEMEIKQILYQETKRWILEKHYAHRMPSLGDGWISTAIQLPPEDTNVLIFEGGQSNLSGWNEPKIGWYNKKFGFQSLTDYLIATHWMNLPNPPNK